MAAAPVVETREASFIGATSAYLNGKCIHAEEDGISYVIFEWGRTRTYGNWTSYETAVSGKDYSHKIEGLSWDTTYHFRIVGRLGGLLSHGADKVFKTLTEAPPTIVTRFMQNIIEFFVGIADWFYAVGVETNSWVYPFWLIAEPFFQLHYWFMDVAWEFSYFAAWVDEISYKIVTTLSLDTIYSHFKGLFDAAENAWDWVSNAWDNLKGNVEDWWEPILDDIKGLISAATQGFSDLVAAWDTFWNITWPELLSVVNSLSTVWDTFWTTIFPNLVDLTWLGIWWDARVTDVSGLIETAFTLRESLWAGWQEIKDSVLEFFADPLEWLWTRFTDWFLGAEE